MSSCSGVGKKQQQHTDPQGEDKKKNKSNISCVWINVYISVWNTKVFRIEYSPKDSQIIYKNLKLKPMTCFFFFFFFNYLESKSA